MLTVRVLTKTFNRLFISLENSNSYASSTFLKCINSADSRNYSSAVKEIDYSNPIKFMESLGVEPGKYIDYALGVTSVKPGVFRGNKLYIHKSRSIAFGGLLLGQAANAACHSLPQDLYISSLHNYFINPGSKDSLNIYVTNQHEGRTYCNKTVCAVQNEKTIIQMQIAFKSNETSCIEHQWKMPKCTPPEDLIPVHEIYKTHSSELMHEQVKNRLPIDPVIEFRPVNPDEMLRIKTLPPKRLTWVTIKENIDTSNQNWNRCILLYVSDYLLLTTSLLPNPNPLMSIFLVSLDHSLWFHNDVDINKWLLYETESSYAGNGQSYNTGRFWSEDGILIASVSQKGILRKMKQASL